MIPLTEYSSIESGFLASNASLLGIPFIVRAANLESINESVFPKLMHIRKQILKEQILKGYKNSGMSHIESGFQCLSDYDDDILSFNIVDSQSTRGYSLLLPKLLQDLAFESGIDSDVWLSYVISPAAIYPLVSIGSTHTDPPYGSGWQYISEGMKQWYIFDHSGVNGTIIYSSVIYAGDFISCPMTFHHCVRTIIKTIGLSGYSSSPILLANLVSK